MPPFILLMTAVATPKQMSPVVDALSSTRVTFALPRYDGLYAAAMTLPRFDDGARTTPPRTVDVYHAHTPPISPASIRHRTSAAFLRETSTLRCRLFELY